VAPDPKRKPGFYWVRFEGQVIIAEYVGSGKWQVPGSDRAWEDKEFCELICKVSRPWVKGSSMTKHWLNKVAASALADRETCEATYDLCRAVLDRDVPGDFVECGVYAGAQAAIMAKALMDYHGDATLFGYDAPHSLIKRRVHLFDTFTGIPAAEPVDHEIWEHHGAAAGESACSIEQVQFNMSQWGIPAELLVYHEGLFDVTVPPFAMHGNRPQIALLRLDGDLYSSTKACLDLLLPRVSRGGWVCVDDFNLHGCRKAVLEAIIPAPIYWRVPTK